MHHQPAGLDLLFRHPFGGEIFLERVAALRRITKPKRLDGPARKPALTQIGPGPRAIGRLQLVLKELRRHFHDVLQGRALTLTPLGLRVRLRHGDTGHIGHLLHGLDKAQPLEIGQKAKMIAGDPATEAVISSLAILAMKARALLAVERAAGPIVLTRHIVFLRSQVTRRPTTAEIGTRSRISSRKSLEKRICIPGKLILHIGAAAAQRQAFARRTRYSQRATLKCETPPEGGADIKRR